MEWMGSRETGDRERKNRLEICGDNLDSVPNSES